MPRVLACGIAVLDVQQTVDRLPEPDEKLEATDLLVASGGPAANAAVTAAALGVDARLVTRIGDSPVGTLIGADLAAHGVDVIDRAGPLDQPAVSTVLVTRGTGERAVVSVNASRRHAALPERDSGAADWARELVRDVGAVLVDGHHLDLALPVAAAAREAGVPVLLDGGSWKPGLERLLALVDVALLSGVFAVPASAAPGPARAGGVLASVATLGPRVVARSRGPRPIEVLTGEGCVEVAVPQVCVVDTLGAGDVLHGALATWLAVRGTGHLLDGLAWSAHIAADSCTAAGARGWLADERLLTEHRRVLDVAFPNAGSQPDKAAWLGPRSSEEDVNEDLRLWGGPPGAP